MPIYQRSYRHFEGRTRQRFRWWIVIEQELRVLATARPFLILLLLALLHCILRLLQVVAYDVVIQDPNHPLTPILRQIQGLMVNEQMFFDFIRLQTPLIFILFLYAGSGMICNDFRYNLMEVYFSKPIRWYDYALGKFLALVLLGLSISAAPAIFLVVLHNMLLAKMEVLQQTWWWPLPILGFSLVVIVPAALAILASSALLPSQNFAAIAIFMILIANSTMAGAFAGLLQNRNYFIISVPMALHR
ncbi:MAG TPA: hypothetical protein ENN65_08815, partial [Candidatus Hydrogenedentes bacterium]|nr:hypothetical protein [Candidatus Hydrogenedentota bacterium]